MPVERELVTDPSFYVYGVLPILERHGYCPVLPVGWGWLPQAYQLSPAY